MIVGNTFLNDENKTRLGFAIGAALLFHVCILIYLSTTPPQKIMASDVFSAATNISIRFVSPVAEKPIERVQEIKKVTPKLIEPKPKKIAVKKTTVPTPETVKPQELNQIKPAAAPPQEKKIEQAIPVVSDKNLKGRRVQPEYPARALRMRQEGVVWIRVLIDEAGTREDITLHTPSQYALLNQAAIKAVKQWTFDPHVMNGRAVKSWVEIPIEFRIQ